MDLEKVKFLIGEGQAAMSKGNWDAASKALTKAEGLLKKMKLDTEGKDAFAEVLKMKSFADARRGQHRIAISAAQKALALSKSTGDMENEADALRMLGYICWIEGDFQKASDFYDEALIKARECGANALVGKVKVELGNIAVDLSQFDEAKEIFMEAAKILRAEKQLSEVARAYNNIGFTFMLQKKYREAVSALKMAMDIADQAGDARLKAMAALNTAECFVMLGSPEVAFELLGPVTDTMIEFDDKAGIASAYRVYGMAYTIAKEWPKAESYFRKAFGLVKICGVTEMEGALNRELGHMYLAKGNKEMARAKLSLALETYKKLNSPRKCDEVQELLMKVDA